MRWLPLLFSLAIILVGIFGRALIDKALALQGGATLVAHWAQLQSLLDIVCGVVTIGLGQGVTVLVAQWVDRSRQLRLLRMALLLGGGVGGGVALGLLIFIWFDPWPTLLGAVSPELAFWAVLVGWLIVVQGVLQADWLGRHRPGRVMLLSGGVMIPSVVVAWHGGSLLVLLQTQALVAFLFASVTVGVVFWRRNNQNFASCAHAAEDKRTLLSYLPVGLAIGLASPISLLLVRGEVSAQLSWQAAGHMQAIWRSAEWVTACMGGVLAAYVLPRFSAAMSAGRQEFLGQLQGAAKVVMLVGGALLLMLLFGQGGVLTFLYDETFVVSTRVVVLFYLGDWLRMGSWVILFGFLAARATRWVTVGEFLSLPLFCLLVLLWPGSVSLEYAGALYLATYAIYLVFNLCGVWWLFYRGAGAAS